VQTAGVARLRGSQSQRSGARSNAGGLLRIDNKKLARLEQLEHRIIARATRCARAGRR
jgi:hypothetical protein